MLASESLSCIQDVSTAVHAGDEGEGSIICRPFEILEFRNLKIAFRDATQISEAAFV